MELHFKKRWQKWLLLFGLFTLMTLLLRGITHTSRLLRGDTSRGFFTNFQWTLFNWYVWGILSIFIAKLCRWFPIERKHIIRNLGITLLAFPVFSLLHSFLYYCTDHLVVLFFPFDEELGFDLLKRVAINEFYINFFIYGGIVAIVHLLDYYRKYQERELQTSQLQAQLSHAQLQVLKMQLQPHFLFNTLNAIAELINEDSKTAEKMVIRLSELLRLTLDSSGLQEVSLKQEMDFLNSYLEIEQIRFEERLTVIKNIDPETLDALVPNLILQPTVENSIRHGIAKKAGKGRIEINTKLEESKLVITISDNGPGLQVEKMSDFKEGLGLANTRQRLKQLYSGKYTFMLQNRQEGGLTSTIKIPFRTIR